MTGATALGILLAHLVGDYLLQPHWLAEEKKRSWGPAILHGLLYTVPYLAVTRSPAALLVIAGTHAVIDRYRLARFVIYAKNLLAPRQRRVSWAHCDHETGFPSGTPAGLACALLIIVDNTLHLILNTVAVMWCA
jgi:membrane-associated phospholipid phosphatase